MFYNDIRRFCVIIWENSSTFALNMPMALYVYELIT